MTRRYSLLEWMGRGWVIAQLALAGTLENVQRTFRDHIPEDDGSIDELTDPRVGTHGGGDTSTFDNIQGAPTGTSRQQALRRLRAARPDLLERVLGGELSPHAAMIEAGFRKPTMTVVADVPSVARVLRARFSAEQLQALIEALLNAWWHGCRNWTRHYRRG